MVIYSPEVSDALQSGGAVVALESTIITHGMPYPQNVETAKQVENTVRVAGAVPATIAILAGKLKAGLTEDELEILGKSGKYVLKCSRRDIPVAVAQGLNGATTVAATMIIARMAGIKVFATGGIGGVHRGAQRTMDISADLQELAQTNVVVVSAGAKAILDIGLTLEYLETMGVPVIGYRTDRFPAFYTRDSGYPVQVKCDSADEIAGIIRSKHSMHLKGGVVVANPIPEEYTMHGAFIREAIDQAIAEADQKNIVGKEVTPWLLARIESLTSGASLESNIELVLNNARLAAEIAAALSGR